MRATKTSKLRKMIPKMWPGKRHGLPKGKAEYIHFKWRLKDRYGLRFNIDAHREIIGMIQHNKAKLVRKDTNTRIVWELPLTQILKKLNPDTNIKHITVVYDNKRKVLVSAGEKIRVDNPTIRPSRNKISTRRTLEDLINDGGTEWE